MSSPSTLRRQIDGRSRNAEAHHIGVPLATSELPRRPGGLISVPGKLTPPAAGGTCNRLTKLLIHVNVERCFGPVHVVVSPENNVGDLIKTAVETYVKEKRRPLLVDTDCRRFELPRKLKARGEVDQLGVAKLLFMYKVQQKCIILFR